MDTELKDLMQQFQQLQQKEVAHWINERNVVEILMKLKQQDMADVIYTFDGKEFLTWPQLLREIRDEVYAQGGRVDVVELPSLIGVDLCHIEKILPQLVAEDPTTLIADGEIITSNYVDSVVTDAAQVLKEQGSLNIPNLARESRLTLMFLTRILNEAIAKGTIKAVLDDNSLHTTQFVSAQRLRIKAALLGVTRPTDLKKLQERHNLYPGLFRKLVESIVTTNKEVAGRIDGGEEYIPHSYEAQRNSQIHSFYAGEGYINYDFLIRNHGIQNPKLYMKRYNPPPVHPGRTEGMGEVEGSADGASSSTARAGKGKRGGGKKKGKSGGSSTAASDQQDSTTNPTLIPSIEAQKAYPLWGHLLEICFLADSSIAGLAGEIEPFLAKEVLSLDILDHLPSSVDLQAGGGSSSSSDSEIVWSRIHALFPRIKSENKAIILDNSMLVQGSLFADLATQVEYVAREDMGPKPSKKKPIKMNWTKLMILLQRKLQWKDLSGGEVQKEKYLTELMEKWRPSVEEIYANVKASLLSKGEVDVKKLRLQVEEFILQDFNELCLHSKHYKWAEKRVEFRQREEGNREGKDAAGVISPIEALKRNIVHHHSTVCSRGFMLLLALGIPDALQALQEKCEGNFSLEEGSPLSELDIATAIDRFPQAVRNDFKKVLAKITAISEQEQEPQALVDLLAELSTSGEILVPLHKGNKKAEKECHLQMKKKCVEEMKVFYDLCCGEKGDRSSCDRSDALTSPMSVSSTALTLPPPFYARCLENCLNLLLCDKFKVFLPLSEEMTAGVLSLLFDSSDLESSSIPRGTTTTTIPDDLLKAQVQAAAESVVKCCATTTTNKQASSSTAGGSLPTPSSSHDGIDSTMVLELLAIREEVFARVNKSEE